MKHIIISTVMIMLASQASVGQTLKTYSGLYEGGQATYTYFEDENGERIKHGKFTYNKKNNGVEAILDKIIPYTETKFASELNTYDGIPFKEIVPTGTDEAPDEGVIFDVAEQMPQFPGGETKLNEYVSTNLKYPEEARKKRIQGKVFVAFVVNSDGSISETQIVRGIDPSCDKEALRLINNMPRWIPGQSDRKKVRTRYTLPIVFRIN